MPLSRIPCCSTAWARKHLWLCASSVDGQVSMIIEVPRPVQGTLPFVIRRCRAPTGVSESSTGKASSAEECCAYLLEWLTTSSTVGPTGAPHQKRPTNRTCMTSNLLDYALGITGVGGLRGGDDLEADATHGSPSVRLASLRAIPRGHNACSAPPERRAQRGIRVLGDSMPANGRLQREDNSK